MSLRASNPTPIWNDYRDLASERHAILSHQRMSQHLIANSTHRRGAPMEDEDILNNSLESTKRKKDARTTNSVVERAIAHLTSTIRKPELQEVAS